MKYARTLIALASVILFFVTCKKEKLLKNIDKFFDENSGPGVVFTLSNEADGNEVIAFHRMANGNLSSAGSFPTGGNGSGGGLGNQGALTFAKGNSVLLAVNAGDNSISSFKLSNQGITLISNVNSGGMRPVSITVHNHIAFVLNAGGDGNISGFSLSGDGTLSAIPNSSRPLSATNADPAQISFLHNGKVLAITEKATNKITTYTVNNGIPGMMHTLTSANMTPFGFAVANKEIILVSEAAGGAAGASTLSSYEIMEDGMISLVEGPLGAGQSAACWVALTNNGKYAYVTNTGSNNISTFGVNPSSGDIDVQSAISASTPAGPIDAALSNNSKFLYVLNAGGQSISGFSVASDGSLSNLQTVSGLPAGANGLVAR